jgi:hypothetical protein
MPILIYINLYNLSLYKIKVHDQGSVHGGPVGGVRGHIQPAVEVQQLQRLPTRPEDRAQGASEPEQYGPLVGRGGGAG